MEIMPTNRILEIPEGATEAIRKIHDLNDPERLAQAINILEGWIHKQDHIVKKHYSKNYLEMKLIFCKGSVEKVKKQLDRMCTLRTLLPKFFTLTNVKLELQNCLDLARIHPLPKLTDDYYRVLMFKMNNKNFTTENFIHLYRFAIVSAEYITANDYVNGIIIMADYSDINVLDLVTKLNTIELHQLVTIINEGYGARIKSIHIITDSKSAELSIKIFKQIVSDKIGNRLHSYTTLEEFQKVLPTEILPVEYGGKERSANQLYEEWIEAISTKEHVEYIKMMNKACTDESKRHAAKFNEEILGIPGSFRSLSVD